MIPKVVQWEHHPGPLSSQLQAGVVLQRSCQLRNAIALRVVADWRSRSAPEGVDSTVTSDKHRQLTQTTDNDIADLISSRHTMVAAA
jgi:hypothetical protein